MSQENLELARRLNALAIEGDIDAVLEFFADDVVLTDLNGPPDEPSTFHGREGALEHWAASADIFEGLHRQIDEWLDVDWVLTVGRWKGRGKASGAEVEARGVNAARWQDGKVVEYIVGFPTKEEALGAVGLPE